MDIEQIPFVGKIGIEQKSDGALLLSDDDSIHNHLGTIHAAALFALAETQSGVYLQEKFAKYNDDKSIVPLLRSSSLKYKNQASGEVISKAFADEENLKKFEEQFLKKGRASISVSVELVDAGDNILTNGEFNWVVQRISQDT